MVHNSVEWIFLFTSSRTLLSGLIDQGEINNLIPATNTYVFNLALFQVITNTKEKINN